MRRHDINRNLIVDIGVSEGNDSDFYLKKGFKVVGLEADPMIFEDLQSRFSQQIADGSIIILNRAASDVSDQTVQFWRNERHPGLSTLVRTEQTQFPEFLNECAVQTVNWQDIIKVAGIPYYCKVDIEGAESILLRSVLRSGAYPEYISVECHEFEPVELLYEIGYRQFKFLNQAMLGSICPHLPNPALEGNYVPNHSWNHASGPFGREVPDRWLNYREAVETFNMIAKLKMSLGILGACWFDCHAYMPADAP